jgi:arylsulfatase A-like enzyme
LPNIIVILADDMGYGDISYYNPESKIPTPNLSRLAEEGVAFTDAHSPSAVCTPTRYGLLTGRYAWRTRLKDGVLWGYSPALIDPGRATLASRLKELGYDTAAIGKWHLGLGLEDPVDYSKALVPGPNSVGFDYFFGIPASLDMDPYLYVENQRAVQLPTDHVAGSAHRRESGGGFWREGPVAPDFRHIDVLPDLTAKAVEFISERSALESAEPFFLYWALSAPHTPWVPTDEFRDRSKAGYYGDFCVQVDWSIGQLLAAIEELPDRDNTLVLFTSDNGSHWPTEDIEKFDHRANGIYRGQKADIWEGGHRVPFIVRWPSQISAGSTSDQLVCHTDIFATVSELLGISLMADEAEDSFSFLHALLGRSSNQKVRETIVHHSVDGMFSIRRGFWKLILGRGSGGFTDPRRIEPAPGEPEGQLYNLDDDPAEIENLYLENPELVEELTALLEKFREQGLSRPL